MNSVLAKLHESFVGTVASCGTALVAGWGSYLATAQSIVGLVAGAAATVYSVYATYTLFKNNRKPK